MQKTAHTLRSPTQGSSHPGTSTTTRTGGAPSNTEAAALVIKGRFALQQGNLTLAEQQFRQAAEAGDADGQAMLAQLYQSGQGLMQDHAVARDWYEKAAVQGNADALLALGLVYQQGLGVTHDDQRALAYFMAAQAAGHVNAPRHIGVSHAAGGDLQKAAVCYSQGAALGDVTSQYLLGCAYERGEGVPRCYGLAVQWFSKVAEQRSPIGPLGMVRLASLYERGLGVSKDVRRAVTLYRQAAAAGCTAALTGPNIDADT